MFFRINPIAQYLVLLAMAIGSYGLYLKFAVPAIEGAARLRPIRSSVTTEYRPPNLKQGFEKLFAADAWELQPCKTVRIDEGRILCQDWLPNDDGQVEIFPFTMVLDSDSGKPPTIIRCMQGAQLQLDGKFSPGSIGSKNSSNKIKTAKLQGQVLIYRPPNPDQPEDNLELTTSNIQIENGEVRTLDPVEFQFGKHRGRGSNLRIELAQASSRAGQQDLSDIEGMKRIRLANLDFLELHPKEKSAVSTAPFTKPRHPIFVRCQGAFDFNLESNMIELSSRVSVVQQNPLGPNDSLTCEQLTLKLAGDSVSKFKDQTQKSDDDVTILSIRATGAPAVLNAPSRNSKIQANELYFDQPKGLVFATSKDENWVTVENTKFTLTSRQVRYWLTDNQSLGDLDATGPGQFKKLVDPNKVQQKSKIRRPFTASWSKQLTIRTDEGKKLITLDGDSDLNIANDTSVQAQILKFWLSPVATSVPIKQEPADLTNQSGAQENADAKTKWDYFPFKLIAMGEVQIASPRVQGTARQLTAHWPEVTQMPLAHNNYHRHIVQRPQSARDSGGPPLQTRQNNASGFETPRQENAPWAPLPQDLQDSNAQQAPKQKSTINFDGDYVTVSFLDHSSKPKIKTLKIDGNVDVRETKPDATPGLRARGTSLHMSPQESPLPDEPWFRIFVAGNSKSLAEIENDSLVVRGQEIHVDQQLNKFWVTGMGEMILREATEQVEVHWHGGMIFDGSNIYFEDRVQLAAMEQLKQEAPKPGSLASRDAVYQLTRTNSVVLNLVLEKPINFKELSRKKEERPGRSEIEIREVVLINQLPASKRVFRLAKHSAQRETPPPVSIDIQSLDKDQKLVERQRFVAPDARIDAIQGTVSAKGPGYITSVRAAKSKQKKSAPFAFGNSPLGNSKHGLSYLRVNFDSGITANQQENKVDVIGNIRALFLGTDDWNLSTDPDELQQVPAGGGKLFCDRIDIDKWQARGYETPIVEFVARGNAQIVGDLFLANSDRISYQDSTDLLIIEGTPRSPAKLWHQETRQSPKTNLVANKIWYRPADQWTQVDKIKSGSYSFDASSKPRSSTPKKSSRSPNGREPLGRIRNR